MRFIVTGGLGYIGAHTVIQLYKAGHTAVILDDCRNSNIETLRKLETIVEQPIPFLNIDISNRTALLESKLPKIDFIIHFAALKNVGESNEIPLEYYHNNISGLLNMLALAKEINCPNFIFSSSCTVYPHTAPYPVTENIPAAASSDRYSTVITGQSPYGTSKLMCEQILHDIAKADPLWNIISLRYFNPVGNHKSGLIGDSLNIIRKNMNLFTAILNNKKIGKVVNIFGNDFPTRDGTPIRDYIHVMDVADAHIRAAEWRNPNKGIEVFNIGTGYGYSVFEIIKKFNQLGFGVKYEISPRREGDLAEIYADSTKANNILGWYPKYSLDEMVQSSIIYYNHQINAG
jgi:UDP-glucose 4-epimerase